MRQAHVALEKGDLRWAALAAQRAMVAAPDSVDACRRLEATRYLDLSTKAALLLEEEALRSQAANQIARR